MFREKATSVFERELSLGFIPKTIKSNQRIETILLIECLIQIQENVKVLTANIIDLISKNECNYQDMFMQSIIQDQKKNHQISLYPSGWFNLPLGNKFDQQIIIDETSDLSCYNINPFSLTIFEFDNVPLVRFRTISSYVVFMFSLYGLEYEYIPLLFESTTSVKNEIRMLDQVVGKYSGQKEILLLEFLLYTALSVFLFKQPSIKQQLSQTQGYELISKLNFPANVLEERGENFYGNILMKIRDSRS